MATVFDVNPSELIEKTAQELKKVVKQPEWSLFIKTGTAKERPPAKDDWWYQRSAAVLRKIYLKGPIGVSKLKTLFGSRKNRGYKPERFRRAGGKIIRVILQQLEKEGLIQQVQKGVHKGRVITPKGKSFIDKLAGNKHGRVGTTKAKEVKGTSKQLQSSTTGTSEVSTTS